MMKESIDEDIYEIKNIASHEGCIVSLIKYAVLFIIGFIVLWAITLLKIGGIGFEHGLAMSIIISIGLLGYIVHKIFYCSDEVYKIIFNDKERKLTLISGNTFDGTESKVSISYDSLLIAIEDNPIFKMKVPLNKETLLSEDKLSQNKKIKFFDSNKLVRVININLSGWCRHEKINTLWEKLIQISSRNKV